MVASGVLTAKGKRSLVYVAGTSNNLHALDAETGEVVWSHDFEILVINKNADV